MNRNNCHCSDAYHGHLNDLAGQHRAGWRNALAGLVSPFVRLHQLRNIRTQMFHEALADLDDCRSKDNDA